MASSDIDSESLQAVKNLRSKFERLASGTSTTTTTDSGSTSNSHLNAGASGSFEVVVTDHPRTSSSSSSVKRPPPPPPPPLARSSGTRAKGPSPSPSSPVVSSPVLRPVPIPPSKSETKDVDVSSPPSVSALRTKFTASTQQSLQQRTGSPPTIPKRPAPAQREEIDHRDRSGLKAKPPPVPIRRAISQRDQSNSPPPSRSSSSSDEIQPVSPIPPPVPARPTKVLDTHSRNPSDSDSSSSLLLLNSVLTTENRIPRPRLVISPEERARHSAISPPPPPPPPLPARPRSLIIPNPLSAPPVLSPHNGVNGNDWTRKPLGASKLPPPPMRTIGLGDKLPPPRRPSSPSSEDESGEEDETKVQAGCITTPGDTMPDSSASSRRPPVFFRFSEPRIHVHPHSGCMAVSGAIVVVGHHHHIKIYDLAQSETPVFNLDTREIGVKDSKVTCMEFRHTLNRADRGSRLWVGTKDGHLFELDIRSGSIKGTKYSAHLHSITHIFRYDRSMITLDESGKTLIYSPSDDQQDVSLSSTSPRVVRTTEKQDFVKLIGGHLWTAARMDHHHGGKSQHHQQQQQQRLPIMRVYDIFNPGCTCRSVLPTEHVGAVTSAAILPSQPGIVYVGHEEGYISQWDLNTDDGFPQCIDVTRVSMSDVLSLEGVNDRLWAGGRNGMISAYDVSLRRPWLVTNSWNAHPGLPVMRLVVNHYGIEKMGQLCVVSVGRDEQVRLWDGLLGLDWVDKELVKLEPSFSTFREMSVLVVSWNCDSARPDTLSSSNDPRNSTFFHQVLHESMDDPPDVIAFGFQEVIDLENRKMAAKNVILGGAAGGVVASVGGGGSGGIGGSGGGNSGKKKQEDALSDKVTGAYKRWYDRLNSAVTSEIPDVDYSVVRTESLVGLFTCVFAKTELKNQFDDVLGSTIKRGMGGRYGNKGATMARFVIGDSSLCFINCHLAAGQNAVRQRNADIGGILEEKAVFTPAEHPVAYVGGGDGCMVLDHEFVILNGDMNYRIDHRREAIVSSIRSGDISNLHTHDQLLREIKFNRACRLRFFTEGPLTFAPTYKYDRNSDEYDTSEKRRPPAWCDRILWHSRVAMGSSSHRGARLLHYKRYEVNVSDHRPISAAFAITVKEFDHEKREKARAALQARWVGEQERLLAGCVRFYVSKSIL